MALIKFKNLPDTSTPITAENLNNNFDKNIITLNLPDLNPASFTEWQPYNITSYTTNSSIGNKLTNVNGIKIGNGVSKIKINGVITISSDINTVNTVSLEICKNGSSNVIYESYSNVFDYGWLTISIPDFLTDAQENDVFTIAISSSHTANMRVWRGHLTAEVVE